MKSNNTKKIVGKSAKPIHNLESATYVRGLGVAIAVVVAFVGGIFTSELTGDLGWGGFGAGDIGNDVDFIGDLSGDTQIASNEVDFDLFWTVWNTMTNQYVDASSVDEEEMFYGSIKGMVESYGDPATLYLDPEETKQYNDSTSGNFFSGIGAELGYDEGRIVIISPFKGSPALEAGVRAGDVVIAVDGEDVTPDQSIYDVVAKIRGEAGTEVTLTVLRQNASDALDITITRGAITVPSMELRVEDGVAVIEVSRFTDATLNEWKQNWDNIVQEIIQSGEKDVVLDLRGNPGGYFDAAVYAAGEFLPEGTVVAQQQNRQGRVNDYTVERKGNLLDVDLVVLVNNGSASASEILSGALQVNERADVVGEASYGKGTAQSIVEYPDGSSLHITILKWLLPDGTWLNRDNVIEPDKVVEFSEDEFRAGEDPQLDTAKQMLK